MVLSNFLHLSAMKIEPCMVRCLVVKLCMLFLLLKLCKDQKKTLDWSDIPVEVMAPVGVMAVVAMEEVVRKQSRLVRI